MRTYLVVMSEGEDCSIALRFAARRAAGSGRALTILAIIPPPEFVQWIGVQETMAEEAKLRAEAMVVQASGTIFEEAGLHPTIFVRQGDPVKVVTEMLDEVPDVAALVVAAKADAPSPLAAHFAGSAAGSLPCPLIVVPCGLGEDALQNPA